MAFKDKHYVMREGTQVRLIYGMSNEDIAAAHHSDYKFKPTPPGPSKIPIEYKFINMTMDDITYSQRHEYNKRQLHGKIAMIEAYDCQPGNTFVVANFDTTPIKMIWPTGSWAILPKSEWKKPPPPSVPNLECCTLNYDQCRRYTAKIAKIEKWDTMPWESQRKLYCAQCNWRINDHAPVNECIIS